MASNAKVASFMQRNPCGLETCDSWRTEDCIGFKFVLAMSIKIVLEEGAARVRPCEYTHDK